MKTIITLLLLLFFSQSVLAVKEYFKGDTIRYRFDDVLVEVASTNAILKSPDKILIQNKIDQIQKVLAEMSIVPPAADERINISLRAEDEDLWLRNFKEIKLTRIKRNSKTLRIFEDGTTFEKELGKYCIHFIEYDAEAKIFVESLDVLDLLYSEAFIKKFEKAANYLNERYDAKGRKLIHAWLDLRGDEVKGYFQGTSNQNFDMLIISGGIGSGWVKNSFVADINLRLGISLGNRGLYKNAYFIDYNMMYDFSDSNENKFYELNHFVSLSWEHNFSNTPAEDKWYGFSLGYLVKRNNDFFKDNTFRVAINKKINNTFSVKPELYFNDFFKNVYPGIRVSVAF